MSPHYLVKFQKVIFQVYHSYVSEYFGYLSIKRTQCPSAAEIITVYLFSNRSSRLECSQALLDKFSEDEVEFIFCEENGISSM